MNIVSVSGNGDKMLLSTLNIMHIKTLKNEKKIYIDLLKQEKISAKKYFKLSADEIKMVEYNYFLQI